MYAAYDHTACIINTSGVARYYDSLECDLVLANVCTMKLKLGTSGCVQGILKLYNRPNNCDPVMSIQELAVCLATLKLWEQTHETL